MPAHPSNRQSGNFGTCSNRHKSGVMLLIVVLSGGCRDSTLRKMPACHSIGTRTSARPRAVVRVRGATTHYGCDGRTGEGCNHAHCHTTAKLTTTLTATTHGYHTQTAPMRPTSLPTPPRASPSGAAKRMTTPHPHH